MRGRRARAALFALLAVVAGCGEDPYHIGPIGVGIVRLDATLTDPNGTPMGMLRNTDWNGVRVWLLEGESRVDSNVTIVGSYGFSMKRGHTYRVLAGVPPAVADTSLFFTPARDAGFDMDTLRLGRNGDLGSRPNPFPLYVTLTFGLPATTHVDLEILDMGTHRVRLLMSQDLVAGLHGVTWDGRDDHGDVVHDGYFWAVLQAPGGDARAELILKQP